MEGLILCLISLSAFPARALHPPLVLNQILTEIVYKVNLVKNLINFLFLLIS